MIADLKARAEGFDKKRIVTAVAVLVIAGAAGHVMQRNASTPQNVRVIAASGPGTPGATNPAGKPSAAPNVVAAGMAPAMMRTSTPEQEPAAIEAVPSTAAEPTADASGLKIVGAGVVAAQADLASTSPEAMAAMPVTAHDGANPTAASLDEVTRSASEPILALAEATAPIGDDPAATEPLTLAAADEAIDLVGAPEPTIASCDIALDAEPQSGALVALTLWAPCNAGGKVEFDHAGLKFSDQLGPEGDLFLLVPAMAEHAIIMATLESGQTQSVEVDLPDVADYERVALMWKGATGLQLHALENGANYGDPGHVWAEAPATPDVATTGVGGFLSVLGSTAEGYAADVYTYPARLIADGAEPQVSIEAQVMENTCAGRIEGLVLRTNAGRTPTAEPLAMAVPGCDAVGEYLVLNNLPQNLKLARN